MKTYYFIFVLLLSLSSKAQDNALFDKATTAYNEGKYDTAIESYLKIIENGEHSAALYYNLGNAYYKMNKIAPSIYYFEKALLLDPNDREIKNNLAHAKNMTLDAIETLPETSLSRVYRQATELLSFDQWGYAAIIFMLLFALSYIAFSYLRYTNQKRISFIASMTFIFLACIALFFGYLQYTDFKSQNPAIIFAEKVVVQSEPNSRSQEVFTLHEGTKVNIVEELNEWKKIELSDGKSGWMPKESIRELKDF